MGASASREVRAGDAIPVASPDAPSLSVWLARRFGLSARLFLLTICFVILVEILIYLPAVASFRRIWLSDRVAAAEVAALALEAAPDRIVPEGLARRLLAGIGARAVAVEDRHGRRLLGTAVAPGAVAETIDLRNGDWLDAVQGAWRTLALPADGPIHVTGSGQDGATAIEVVLDEGPLRQAMLGFSLRLLLSSLVVAAGAAALVFVVLQRVFLRPVRRLARNIAAFADDPESTQRVIAPSGRIDEIGDAEAALARMEIALAGELRHKRRLAGLGLSVSKISHELRNLLTTAQLLVDRLEGVADPLVQRVAPRLVATLDRANRFCEATLAYGRAAEQHPRRRLVPLAPIVAELADLTNLARDRRLRIRGSVARDLMIDADPEQLARALTNLVRNAVQALDAVDGDAAPTITVSASRDGGPGSSHVTILVSDNGPGLPERARTHLFAPFQGSMRAGGTGLGLAIAAELVELNGGTLGLDPTPTGAHFRIVIPDRTTRPEAV